MKIEFSTDNAVFCDPKTSEEDVTFRAMECVKILREITFLVSCHYTNGAIKDSNGNVIGNWNL